MVQRVDSIQHFKIFPPFFWGGGGSLNDNLKSMVISDRDKLLSNSIT